MPRQLSRDERREYQRLYRARKKGLQVSSEPEVRPHDPVVDIPVDKPVDTVDMPTAKPVSDWRKKLLAAPDDDCVTCKHDRHTTHPGGGACKAPTGNGRTCLCRRFHAAGTSVAPCLFCGHDQDGGHAVEPCDAWGAHGPCGCPAFVDAAEPF